MASIEHKSSPINASLGRRIRHALPQILFVLIALPSTVLLIGNFILDGIYSLLGKQRKKTGLAWETIVENPRLKVDRIGMLEEEYTGKVSMAKDQVDLFFFRLKSEPQIPYLEEHIFDFNQYATEEALYLIQYNPPQEGTMSIIRIDLETHLIEKMQDIAPNFWNIEPIDGRSFIFYGELDQQYISYHIREDE